MSPEIRGLRAGDRSAWEVLWRGYLDFYETSLPDSVTQLAFQRLLDPAEPMFALVAVRADAPIGFAHCVLHRATWTATHYCYLEDLFVDARFRGAGVGRALIETVYARADDEQATRVYWLTRAGNSVAQALYDKIARKTDFIQYRHP